MMARGASCRASVRVVNCACDVCGKEKNLINEDHQRPVSKHRAHNMLIYMNNDVTKGREENKGDEKIEDLVTED